MHQLSIAIFVTVVISAVNSASLGRQKESLYDSISNMKDEHYKCPYLKELLLKPDEYEFLQRCEYTTKVYSGNDPLCILFYNNFMELCFYSNEFPIKTLLNESTIKASMLNAEGINTVCKNLNTTRAITKELNKTIEGIIRKLEKNDYCKSICTDLENKPLQICAVSGLIRNVSLQIIQNAAKAKPVNKTVQLPVNPTLMKSTKPTDQISKDVKKSDPTPAPSEQITDKTEIVTEVHKGGPIAPEVKLPPVVGAEVTQVKAVESQSPTNDAKAPETGDVKPGSEASSPADAKKPDVGEVELETEQEKPYAGSQEDLTNDDIELQNEMAPDTKPNNIKTNAKPKETHSKAAHSSFADANDPTPLEEEDSFFFMYFMMVCAVCIIGYIGYHNKQKVLALVIEGRRGRRSSRRAGRPNSANYHKLDSNLEEAVTSGVQKNPTNIIY